MASSLSPGKKAAQTRKRRATAKKAVLTRKRRRTARKAMATKRLNTTLALTQAAIAALDAGDLATARKNLETLIAALS